MNWENLKNRKCPKCGRKLLRAHLFMRCSGRKGGIYEVKQSSACNFTISKQRYAELGGRINPSEEGEYNFYTNSQREDLQYRQRVLEEVKRNNRKEKKRRQYERKNHGI